MDASETEPTVQNETPADEAPKVKPAKKAAPSTVETSAAAPPTVEKSAPETRPTKKPAAKPPTVETVAAEPITVFESAVELLAPQTPAVKPPSGRAPAVETPEAEATSSESSLVDDEKVFIFSIFFCVILISAQLLAYCHLVRQAMVFHFEAYCGRLSHADVRVLIFYCS